MERRLNFDDYHFVYTAAAYFDAEEKYPEGLINELNKPGVAGYAAICWTLEEMSTQGELRRRAMGYDKGEILTAAAARALMMPMDVVRAREIILTAMTKGMRTKTDEDEEVDEVLAELQKKTADSD